MTQHLAQKFIFFLSDLGISSSEFSSFSEWLKNGGLEKSIDMATVIRNDLANIIIKPKAVQKNIFKNNNTKPYRSHGSAKTSSSVRVMSSSQAHEDKVFKEVFRLLVKELKLKKSVVLKTIAERLGYLAPIPEGIPLREGIDRLIAFGGESKVLNIAQMIKNEKSPSIVSDWPLVTKNAN